MGVAIFIFNILLFFTYLTYKLFVYKKNNEFNNLMQKEAERCINNFCEIDDKWNPPQGRLFVKGFIVIKNKNKKYFIKQGKLFDIGLLE